LYLGAINAGSRPVVVEAASSVVATFVVDVDDVKGVDVAREVSQDRKQNIDEEITTATCDKSDT
jgi:hypothetical protein